MAFNFIRFLRDYDIWYKPNLAAQLFQFQKNAWFISIMAHISTQTEYLLISLCPKSHLEALWASTTWHQCHHDFPRWAMVDQLKRLGTAWPVACRERRECWDGRECEKAWARGPERMKRSQNPMASRGETKVQWNDMIIDCPGKWFDNSSRCETNSRPVQWTIGIKRYSNM